MDCKNCILADEICLVADMIKKKSLIMNIFVADCKTRIRKNEPKSHESAQNVSKSEIIKEKKVVLDRELTGYKNFNIKDQPEETLPGSSLMVCPECKGTTTMDDILPCSKCGVMTCSNCGTENEGHRLCDTCWKAL